ncbi:MAG TPA: bifunctional phosphoribosylaminoimidazolecarboxamide formyltransferase/IMP cyclohydrolase, partial [Chloroflexota bacterium]
ARGLALVGFGSGQPSRQDAVDLACRKAGERAAGSVLASDGFFPFPDALERAADAGITAVIQPGGSSRDPELIRVANRHGMAMIFTGERHYRH